MRAGAGDDGVIAPHSMVIVNGAMHGDEVRIDAGFLDGFTECCLNHALVRITGTTRYAPRVAVVNPRGSVLKKKGVFAKK